MNVEIRDARESDAASIIGMLNPIIDAGVYTIMDERVSVDDQIEFMRTFPARGVYHVAVCAESGRVVGMQDVVPTSTSPALRHVGEISTFVSLDCARRGIGRRLTSAALERACANGFRRITATVRADNPQAISFYLAQGFERIGTARRYTVVRGEYLDGILLERWIRRT